MSGRGWNQLVWENAGRERGEREREREREAVPKREKRERQ
jgi:hypothetical protein